MTTTMHKLIDTESPERDLTIEITGEGRVVSLAEKLPKTINWNQQTATLRTVQKEHVCAVCGQTIKGKAYSIVMWNAGLAGKKFPTYVHPEHLEEYQRRS
jgi:hypothetical protein